MRAWPIYSEEKRSRKSEAYFHLANFSRTNWLKIGRLYQSMAGVLFASESLVVFSLGFCVWDYSGKCITLNLGCMTWNSNTLITKNSRFSPWAHQFMQLGKRNLKKIQGFKGIRTRDLREYRCDALPTELWCQTLRARLTRWSPEFFSGFFFPIA